MTCLPLMHYSNTSNVRACMHVAIDIIKHNALNVLLHMSKVYGNDYYSQHVLSLVFVFLKENYNNIQ